MVPRNVTTQPGHSSLFPLRRIRGKVVGTTRNELELAGPGYFKR